MRMQNKIVQAFCVSRSVVLLLAGALAWSGCGHRNLCPQTSPPQAGAFTSVAQGVKAPWRFAHDPQDAKFVIDSASSTFCYDDGYALWQSAVSGTADLTIDPTCTGVTCMVTITELLLTADDLTSSGHEISKIDIQNQQYLNGLWQTDGTFAMYSGAVFTNYFDFDGTPYGHAVTYPRPSLWGTLDANYDHLSFAGDEIREGKYAISLSISGHPVARPPVPVLTPSGPFQADALGVAHVTFSAAQSHDPDGDIKGIEWQLDGVEQFQARGMDVFPTSLTVGAHSLKLTVADGRRVERSTSTTVTVVY